MNAEEVGTREGYAAGDWRRKGSVDDTEKVNAGELIHPDLSNTSGRFDLQHGPV